MPETARRIRALLADPRSTNADIEQVLLCDPAAVLALYQAMEQARPGSGEELSGPAHALSMLGREAFARLFGQLPTIDQASLAAFLSPAFGYSQAAHAGWYAREIGRVTGFGHPVEMQVAALLQHPTILDLWTRDPEGAARASNAVRDGVASDTAFGAELGEELKTADRRLATAWRLPRLAREAIGDWDPANRLPQSISLPTRMAEIACAGWPPEEVDIESELLAQLIPHHHWDARSWWYHQTVDAARQLASWSYPLPARELLLLPGGEETVELPRLPRWWQQDASTNGKEPLQQALGRALRELATQSGCRRVILMLLDRERKRLKTRFAMGVAEDSPLRGLDIPIREKHLFSLMLSRGQGVRVTPGNLEKYRPYLRPTPPGRRLAGGIFRRTADRR